MPPNVSLHRSALPGRMAAIATKIAAAAARAKIAAIVKHRASDQNPREFPGHVVPKGGQVGAFMAGIRKPKIRTATKQNLNIANILQ